MINIQEIIKARAPGKLILVGEHAVAQGAPALVMAVDYCVTVTLAPATHDSIAVEFCNFQKKIKTSLSELKQLKKEIDLRFQQYKNQQLSISAVLEQPIDLALYTIAKLLEAQPLTRSGLNITLDSTIPIGCGLGSSAATIMSLYTAFQAKPNLACLKEIESLQHGTSSGVDLTVSLLGGCHYFLAGKTFVRQAPAFPLYLANTGARASGSGAAINQVAASWQNNNLLPAFTEVANQMDKALAEQDRASFAAALTANHQLLCELGIVPAKVKSFIAALEQQGFAAKISGAGAVTGEQAGIVIISGTGDPRPICEEFGYSVARIAGEVSGAQVI